MSTSPSLAALSLASFPPVFLFAAWKGRHMKKEQVDLGGCGWAWRKIESDCFTIVFVESLLLLSWYIKCFFKWKLWATVECRCTIFAAIIRLHFQSLFQIWVTHSLSDLFHCFRNAFYCQQAKVQESLGLANGVATQAIGYLRGLRGLGQDQALLPKFADAVATVLTK